MYHIFVYTVGYVHVYIKSESIEYVYFFVAVNKGVVAGGWETKEGLM